MDSEKSPKYKREMFEKVIARHGDAVRSVLPFDIRQTSPVIFDLTAKNSQLQQIDMSDARTFSQFVFAQMERYGTPLGVGRYDEDRVVYRHSMLFTSQEESRSIHLGIDLFVPPGTPVFSPLPSQVHSFANNHSHGNYGPTIILEHRLEELVFYTLYGHLSIKSLDSLFPGRQFTAGESVGWIGDIHENGQWPPHLHFQVMLHMGEWQGDFPGVAQPSQRQKYLDLCPNPNILLGIQGLPY